MYIYIYMVRFVEKNTELLKIKRTIFILIIKIYFVAFQNRPLFHTHFPVYNLPGNFILMGLNWP